LITLGIYFISQKREKEHMDSAIATFLLGIYYIDYLKIIYIPISFLIYKKIIMTSLYLGIGFYTLAMSKFFKNKVMNFIMAFTLIGYGVILIISKTMVDFKQCYDIWYAVLLFNIILWVFITIKNIKNNKYASIFFIGFAVLGIYSGFSIILELMDEFFPFNSPLVYIVILVILPLLLSTQSMRDKDYQLIKEKKLKETEIINSMTDELTGTWNKRYLFMKMKEERKQMVLAMIDFDDFKIINDTYGHLAGDFILKKVTSLLMGRINTEDSLCRYGGDEFIVIFDSFNERQAYQLLEDFRARIEKTSFLFNGNKLSLTLSIGISKVETGEDIETVLSRVDKRLYRSKQEGKNNVYIKME
jgi:diguanylate cyclase (GGDEF)-like protein